MCVSMITTVAGGLVISTTVASTVLAKGGAGAYFCLSLSHRLSSNAAREFFIDNLLVRIHFIIEMIWWTGLAP